MGLNERQLFFSVFLPSCLLTSMRTRYVSMRSYHISQVQMRARLMCLATTHTCTQRIRVIARWSSTTNKCIINLMTRLKNDLDSEHGVTSYGVPDVYVCAGRFVKCQAQTSPAARKKRTLVHTCRGRIVLGTPPALGWDKMAREVFWKIRPKSACRGA